MPSTPDDVRTALTLLRVGYPDRFPELSDDTTLVWWDALQHFDAELLTQAAQEWVHSAEKFPGLAQFLACVQGCSRRRAQSAPPPPELPPARPASKEYALAHIALQKSYKTRIPQHDHRRGLDDCPNCSTRAEREAWLNDEMRKIDEQMGANT